MHSKLFDNSSKRFIKAFSSLGSGIAGVLLASILFLAIPTVTLAAEFYVDPDYPGTGNGSMSAPWKSLDGSATSAWSAINAALASSDVTVYFSAREAASDIDEISTKNISIRRIDVSSHRLTLDGMSRYNKNDTAPAWVPYSGSKRFKINSSSYSIDSTFNKPKRNYVTIRGFKCAPLSGKAFYYWGGDHIVVENNEFSGVTSSPGSLVMFEYAHRVDPNDTRQNGGCTDLTFRNNIVRDAAGEGIYIGGSSDTGLLSHSDVKIENNIVYNTGKYGGEGDGIDIKDGMQNVVVYNNIVSNGTAVGIVSHSPITAEKNVVTGMTKSGIELNTYWGRGYKNVVLKGNLVFNNQLKGISVRTESISRPISQVLIAYNTVIRNVDYGIEIRSTNGVGGINGVVVKNNISAYNIIGLRVYQAANWSISNNNILSNPSGDYSAIPSQKGINGNISSDPLFLTLNNISGPDGRYWTDDDGLQLSINSPSSYASDLGGAIGAYFLRPPNNLAVRN